MVHNYEKYAARFQELINKRLYEDAWSFLEQLNERKQIDLAFFWSNKGVIAMLLGEYISAKKYFEKGIKEDLKFGNFDLHYNYLYLLKYMGHKMEFDKYYANLLMLKPEWIPLLQDELPFEPFSEFKNILIGTRFIGNQQKLLSDNLKKHGFSVQTVDYYPNYLGYKADVSLNSNDFNNGNEMNQACKDISPSLIAQTDLFHFNFATSLTLDYSDLKVIKSMNKPIVMQFWGSDIRLKSAAIKNNPYIKVKDSNEENIIQRMKYLSQYVDVCMVDYELREYAKDYFPNTFISRTLFDFNNIIEVHKKFDNKKIRIVHAPTSRDIKGSNFIITAVNELKRQFDIDFILIENMAHDEAIKIYRTADIVVDQLHVGLYGILAVECMAMGIPVVTWITDKNKEYLGSDLPIISANPDNIKMVLSQLIRNREILVHASEQGKIYARKNHNASLITEEIVNMYYNTWNSKR